MKLPASSIALFISFMALSSSGLALADELPVLGPKPFMAYFQPISISTQLSKAIEAVSNSALGPYMSACG